MGVAASAFPRRRAVVVVVVMPSHALQKLGPPRRIEFSGPLNKDLPSTTPGPLLV